MASKASHVTEAQRLVKKLVKLGWTATSIAAQMGVHHQTVIRWRDGDNEPHNGTLIRLRGLLSAAPSTSA